MGVLLPSASNSVGIPRFGNKNLAPTLLKKRSLLTSKTEIYKHKSLKKNTL
jgi:hypothetical protein